MKKNNSSVIFNHKNKFLRVISLFIIIFFISQCYIIPSIYSLTIEEQAGRKERRNNDYREREKERDEFSRKAPERVDSRRQKQERDPRLACLLSLMVPGSGHIYLRKDIKGIGFCLLTGSFYGAAGYYLYIAFKRDYDGTEKKAKYIISGVLFAVAVIVHVVGIVEAYNDAVEINEKQYYYGKNKSKSPYIARFYVE